MPLISWIKEAYSWYLGTFPFPLIRIRAYAGDYEQEIMFVCTHSKNMKTKRSRINKRILVNTYLELQATRVSSVNI